MAWAGTPSNEQFEVVQVDAGVNPVLILEVSA